MGTARHEEALASSTHPIENLGPKRADSRDLGRPPPLDPVFIGELRHVDTGVLRLDNGEYYEFTRRSAQDGTRGSTGGQEQEKQTSLPSQSGFARRSGSEDGKAQIEPDIALPSQRQGVQYSPMSVTEDGRTRDTGYHWFENQGGFFSSPDFSEDIRAQRTQRKTSEPSGHYHNIDFHGNIGVDPHDFGPSFGEGLGISYDRDPRDRDGASISDISIGNYTTSAPHRPPRESFSEGSMPYAMSRAQLPIGGRLAGSRQHDIIPGGSRPPPPAQPAQTNSVPKRKPANSPASVNTDDMVNNILTNIPVVVSGPTPCPTWQMGGPCATSDASSEMTSSSDNSRRATIMSTVTSIFPHHEMPGETLVFERETVYAWNYDSGVQQKKKGCLKVFRSEDGKKLRFLTGINDINERSFFSETVNINDAMAEYVPAYTHDPTNEYLVYVQGVKDKIWQALTPIYQFVNWNDLRYFQSILLSENIRFDIDKVFSVRFQRDGSNEVNNYNSGCRIQLWQEQIDGNANSAARLDRTGTGILTRNHTFASGIENSRSLAPTAGRGHAAGSIVTSGTVMSGPSPEKTRVANSRMVVFLGRSAEFLTLFLTGSVHASWKEDGVTVEISGLHPKPFGISSKSPFRCRHYKDSSGTLFNSLGNFESTVGIPLTKKTISYMDESNFEKLRFLELKFESSKERTEFQKVWARLMVKRKENLEEVKKTNDEMSKEAFTAGDARKVMNMSVFKPWKR